MPPCHGGGRGFESRPVRKKTPNPLIIKGFFILGNIQDNLLPHATKVLSEATFPDTFRTAFFEHFEKMHAQLLF
jgi:hypothetical protein